MRLRVRLTADLAGAALLTGAAAVLLTTPYDGGACRNVASAYALPAASLPHAEPPAPPAALADARAAVSAASSAIAGLSDDRAAAEKAEAAAQQAREAADEAEQKTRSAPYPTSSTGMTELDVTFAESKVASAESWLETVQQGAAEDDPLYAVWTEQDVTEAQEELDTARGELASAKKALEAAQGEQAASEAAAAAAERDAETLATAADAAEQAADDAASALATAEQEAEGRLTSAKSRVAVLEIEHEVTQADWSHEQRVERDEVAALNNVRSSCRENGAWRAGVALVDVALLGALALRAWWPTSLRPTWPPRLSWRLRLRR